MLGTSAGVAKLEDLSMGNPDRLSTVRGVVDWYGPSDFLQMDKQLEESGLRPLPGREHNGATSPESLLLGHKITEIPEQVRAANPLTYVKPKAPPFLIQHGAKDAVVPVQQSVVMAAGLRAVLGADKVTLELLQEAGHGDKRFETTENVDRVLDFLDKHLKSD
jgi:dipeptidyl aminopeptidase/acylaminoacyl peptidase